MIGSGFRGPGCALAPATPTNTSASSPPRSAKATSTTRFLTPSLSPSVAWGRGASKLAAASAGSSRGATGRRSSSLRSSRLASGTVFAPARFRPSTAWGEPPRPARAGRDTSRAAASGTCSSRLARSAAPLGVEALRTVALRVLSDVAGRSVRPPVGACCGSDTEVGAGPVAATSASGTNGEAGAGSGAGGGAGGGDGADGAGAGGGVGVGVGTGSGAGGGAAGGAGDLLGRSFSGST
jgi:hypothetical protein